MTTREESVEIRRLRANGALTELAVFAGYDAKVEQEIWAARQAINRAAEAAVAALNQPDDEAPEGIRAAMEPRDGEPASEVPMAGDRW